ncbi:ABC transporter substrate-binding protein [Clostridium sp.]|uniref:ABC transporter substrate-binding protein n=1 Tax=Clostridium sp. TaxID=1506 RepID=UPI0026023C29|nr:extracellular solute-binding protein [uncultured Clostridium sp.]
MKGKCIRFLTQAIAFSITATLLVGCGSSNGQAVKKSGQATVTPVKLTWWTFQNSDSVYMKAMVAKYNKENKVGVTIDYVVQSSNNFRQALDLAFQSNQAPDIFTGQDIASYYVPKGQIEPLDKYLTPAMKARYGTKLYSEGDNGVDGKIYSLINTGITYRLMYNKDLFKKAGIAAPPKTVNEMVVDAKKITEVGKADKAYGFAINMKNTQTSIERSINIIGQMSGFRNYDYKTGLFNFSPYKPIVQAFATMAKDGSMFPGFESLDVDPMRTQFAQGKIGMYLSGAWEPSWYDALSPKSTVDYAAAPVPTIDGNVKAPAYISGLRWLFMSSKSAHKDQVWDAIKFFYSDAVQTGYNEKGLGVVMVPSVLAKSKKSTIKAMSDFLPTKEDAIYPPIPNVRALKIEGSPFNDIFANVITGGTTFDKEIGPLNKKYNDALDQAIKSGKVKDYKKANFNPSSLIGK